MIAFGPIPSRRLGRSLGINNIPSKTCSYSCIYCQAGRTTCLSTERKEFYPTENIYKDVEYRIKQLRKNEERIDYLTFVPDGEPTLDINLGNTINKLKELEFKIAVITNSSLLWDDNVKEELLLADLVSLKVDSVFTNLWKKINRPYGRLNLRDILNGIKDFASVFNGILLTETMLIDGINDSVESIYKTAEFIKNINPDKAFLLIPTRPPAEDDVTAPDLKTKSISFQIFSSLIKNTYILDYNEGVNFSFSSEAEKELLSILSVHPMRQDAVKEFLIKSNSSWDLIKLLINEEVLRTEEYSGNTFYLINT